MSQTPLTDWCESHLTSALGRLMTQTYWDAAPGKTTFRSAWEQEPQERGRLRVVAKNYVTVTRLRPLGSSEMLVSSNPEVSGFEPGTKVSGFDFDHFVVSVLSDIVCLLGPKDEIARRAYATLIAHVDSYLYWPNSWLSLESQSYGQTGRCRKAAMCMRALVDAAKAAYTMGESDRAVRLNFLAGRHIQRVLSLGKDLRDDAQGDGLLIPHWRGFQAAMAQHALDYCCEAVYDMTFEPAGFPVLRDAVSACVCRNESGGVMGVWYDVPEPLDTPKPWPGASLRPGDGVALWLYKYLPADAQKYVLDANKNLDPAVKIKFGMPVA